MSKNKPGLFRRLKNAISSTVNDAVDSVRDPGQELALMLDDLANQIRASEKDLRQAVVDRKVMERKLEELRKKEAGWQSRAEQALKLNDEDLARAALQRKSEVTAQRTDTESGLEEQRGLVERMQEQIEQSKARLKSLNLRRGSLMAQARAVKQGTGSEAAGIGDRGASSRLDEVEARIAEVEAFNEVTAETQHAEAEAAQVDAKLSQLDEQSALDDELARLKAKMQGGGALTEGSSKSSEEG